MIPGHLDNIAHGIRVQIKTSGPDKVEAGVDSTGIIRDHEAHIVPWAGARIRISSHVKAEAGVDSTRITRGHEARIVPWVRA